jgi:hypothetical protein
VTVDIIFIVITLQNFEKYFPGKSLSKVATAAATAAATLDSESLRKIYIFELVHVSRNKVEYM